MAEVPAKLALPAPRAERMSLLLARCAALMVIAIGALVLAAWRIGTPGVAESLPSLAGMTPNASVATIAAGIALFCFTFRPLRPLARLIGFALVILGLLVLCEDLLGFDLGLDHALFPSTSPDDAALPHARMAPGITGSLILFGLALLYAKRGWASSAFSQVVTIIVLAQVLIVLAGYAYGVATYYYPFPFTSMSIYGAASAFSPRLWPDRSLAGIWRRRGHRRAIAGRRDAAASFAGHPRLAAGDRLVRPPGGSTHLLRQRRDARHLRRGKHSRACRVRLDHDRRGATCRPRSQRRPHGAARPRGNG